MYSSREVAVDMRAPERFPSRIVKTRSGSKHWIDRTRSPARVYGIDVRDIEELRARGFEVLKRDH